MEDAKGPSPAADNVGENAVALVNEARLEGLSSHTVRDFGFKEPLLHWERQGAKQPSNGSHGIGEFNDLRVEGMKHREHRE